MTLSEIYETANIRRLPVDPVDIARSLGIKVVDYKAAADYFGTDIRRLYMQCPLGFGFMEDNGCCIALNSNSCGERRRRFTAAHELAHCVLGHLGKEISAREERSAERFAAELLAPLAVLYECGVSSAEETARFCGISRRAAELRVEELAERERAGFCKTEDEQRLTSLLGEFIKNYRENR